MRISDWGSDVCSSDLFPSGNAPALFIPVASGWNSADDQGTQRGRGQAPGRHPQHRPGDGRGLPHLGIEQPGQLAGKDPYALYERLCAVTGVRHDPCVIDTFISAVRFMEGAPPYPWWHYTPEPKSNLAVARP